MPLDDKVRRLSKPQPNGYDCFMRLLVGPELSNVPGLFHCWDVALAKGLEWSLEGFHEAFTEVYREGLAEADWGVGLVWVRNAIEHNEPESPNVVASWANTIAELPECDLKKRAIARLFEWIKAKAKASDKAKAKSWLEAWAKACPNQEQEQEQKQEQKREETPRTVPLREERSEEPEPESKPRTATETQQADMSELKRRLREEPTRDLCKKASQYSRDPFASTMDPPKLWPETMAMAACFADAYGAPHRHLGDLPRDSGLATLLAILSSGITPQEYFRAVALSTDDNWFSKLKSPGLTTLTLEQVRRLLAEADERGAA